jgi:hypothetical protein
MLRSLATEITYELNLTRGQHDIVGVGFIPPGHEIFTGLAEARAVEDRAGERTGHVAPVGEGTIVAAPPLEGRRGRGLTGPGAPSAFTGWCGKQTVKSSCASFLYCAMFRKEETIKALEQDPRPVKLW